MHQTLSKWVAEELTLFPSFLNCYGLIQFPCWREKILLLLASIKGSFCRPRQMTPFRQICSEKFLQVLLQDISKLQTCS